MTSMPLRRRTVAYLNGIFTDENSLAAFTKSSGETSCNKKTPRIRQTNPRLLTLPADVFIIIIIIIIIRISRKFLLKWNVF